MNRMSAAIAGLLALALLPSLAAACTESTFRSNFGMRQYTAKREHPARILIVEGDSAPSQRDRERLYAGLRRAGLEVVPVAGSESAAQALGGGPFDVVLAPPAAAEKVLADIDARQAGQGSGSVLPTLVTVLAEDADCALCIREDAHLREVLRVIARALHGS